MSKEWVFDRYVDGQKKAEGCRITRAETLKEATEIAQALFREDAPRSEFRLRPAPLGLQGGRQ